MRTLLVLLVVFGMTAFLVGCGNDADRGVNKDKDRPKATDKAGQ